MIDAQIKLSHSKSDNSPRPKPERNFSQILKKTILTKEEKDYTEKYGSAFRSRYDFFRYGKMYFLESAHWQLSDKDESVAKNNVNGYYLISGIGTQHPGIHKITKEKLEDFNRKDKLFDTYGELDWAPLKLVAQTGSVFEEPIFERSQRKSTEHPVAVNKLKLD